MLARMTKLWLHRMTRLSIVVPLAAIVLNASAAFAQGLGSASTFGVLGGPAVTCTTSTVNGDVGVLLNNFTSIGCTIVPPGMLHAGDAAASAAYAAFLSAHNALAVVPPGCITLTGTLAGVTLPPGNYCFPAAAALTGTLFLDAQFNANAAWTFRIGTLGTGALTATNFAVSIINQPMPGAASCNVTWWVRDGATLTTSTMLGTVLAGADMTVTGGALVGHAFAKGAVTVTDTVITACGAGGAVVPPVVDKCDEHHDGDGDDDDDDGDHHDKDGDHHDKDGDHHDKDGDRHDNDGDHHAGDHHDDDHDKDCDHHDKHKGHKGHKDHDDKRQHESRDRKRG
jgi:hypothetical protein